MARWRLTQPHYLKVLDNDWEYKEVNRSTGRQERRAFNVPRYLDPNDSGDWNITRNKDDGDIIVTNIPDGGEYPNDYYFIGSPTPDMQPMDKEAEAISASYEAKWKHPIESLSGTFSQSLIDNWQKEMADVQTKSSVSNDNIAAALSQIAETQAMLVKLMAKTTGPVEGIEPAATLRRA